VAHAIPPPPGVFSVELQVDVECHELRLLVNGRVVYQGDDEEEAGRLKAEAERRMITRA
jgi:hypothetical protein